MATAKLKCSLCDEENGIYQGKESSKTFCFNHLTEHRETNKKQFDQIEDDCNSNPQTLINQKDDSKNCPSIAQTLIHIDIDGKKHCLKLPQSSNVVELRTILSKQYQISFNTHFHDGKDYIVFPEDEESVTISHLLHENTIVKLVTDKSESAAIPIPERKKLISV